MKVKVLVLVVVMMMAMGLMACQSKNAGQANDVVILFVKRVHMQKSSVWKMDFSVLQMGRQIK